MTENKTSGKTADNECGIKKSTDEYRTIFEYAKKALERPTSDLLENYENENWYDDEVQDKISEMEDALSTD